MVFRTNMTEVKDLKPGEAETPAGEEPVKEKPEALEEDELLKKQEAEEKETLEKAKKKAEDQEGRALKAEEEARKLKAELEAKTQVSEIKEDIPDWRIREKEGERTEMFIRAQRDIAKKYSFLQKENDLDGSNWTKFKEACDKYGGPKSYTLEGIKEEYEGFIRMALPKQVATQTQSPDSVVVESGVGDDTSSELKTKTDEPDVMTRELNPDEKMAAGMFPGGEKAYREELAKIEEEHRNN